METFDVIEILGRKALFSNWRLAPSEVPEGLYTYDIREDGEYGVLERKVIVDHEATIVTAAPIDFPKEGFIVLDEDSSPNFWPGDKMTLQEFAQNNKK